MSSGLRIVLLASALATGASLAPAQAITNPPPVCFGFNHPGPAGAAPTWLWVSEVAGLTAHFVAPVSATVDTTDLSVIFCWCMPPLVVDVFATPALGMTPTAPPLAGFRPPPSGHSAGWTQFATTTPVAFVAGASYAVNIRATAGVYGAPPCWSVQYDAAGPQQLSYRFEGSPACPASLQLAPTGQIGLMIAFRGIGCGPGPLASAATVGVDCGSPFGTTAANLGAPQPATLGAPFHVWINSVPSATAAALFWSVGVNPAGSPIAAGSPCLHYLDPASLAALSAAGAEPLAIVALVQGSGNWQATVPFVPAAAGAVLGLQALLLDPTGTIALGGGAFGVSTNALQLLIGY